MKLEDLSPEEVRRAIDEMKPLADRTLGNPSEVYATPEVAQRLADHAGKDIIVTTPDPSGLFVARRFSPRKPVELNAVELDLRRLAADYHFLNPGIHFWAEVWRGHGREERKGSATVHCWCPREMTIVSPIRWRRLSWDVVRLVRHVSDGAQRGPQRP